MSDTEQPEAPAPGRDDEIKLLDVALLLAENVRLLILAPLAAGVIALGITFLIRPTYTATTRVIPPQYPQSSAAAIAGQLGALVGLPEFVLGAKSTPEQYVSLIESRTVADRIIDRFHLKAQYDKKYLDDVRKELKKNTAVSAGLKDGIISISVDDTDPKQAAAMANAYVEEVRTLTNTLAITEAAQRRQFFQNQLKVEQRKLAEAEATLRETGVGEASLKASPALAVGEIAALRARIKAQEVRLSVMNAYSTGANPEFRQALDELQALRGQLASADANYAPGHTGSSGDYVAKYRDFKYHETLFEQLAKQLEVARLDEARDSAAIQVVDLALPPEHSSHPKRAIITTLSAVSMLFLAVLCVFVRKGLERATRNADSAIKLSRLRELMRLGRT